MRFAILHPQKYAKILALAIFKYIDFPHTNPLYKTFSLFLFPFCSISYIIVSWVAIIY